MSRDRSSSGFGVRLRELRAAKGLSLRDLATVMGVTHQAIAKYETGDTEPTWPVVLRLAAALGVSTAAFETLPASATDPPTPISKRK